MMAKNRSRIVLAALIGCVCIGSNSFSQEPPASPFEAGYFDHDMQFFAPAEWSEFGNGPDAPIGWYFDYRRMLMSLSGPSGTATGLATANRGQWGWGNRFQIGYMTNEQKGWSAEIYRQSVPVTTELNSIEVNRVFRLNPLEDGGIVEVFAGPRFVNFQDRVITFPDGVTLNIASTSNNMVGAQLGTRWFRRKGRWQLSTEGRGFVMQNFQAYNNPAGPSNNSSGDEFVWGANVRAEAAYILTKDISIVSGIDILGFGQGIGRQNDPFTADQEMIVSAFTFGFVFGR